MAKCVRSSSWTWLTNKENTTLREQYIRKSHGILLVYSIHSHASFDEIIHFRNDALRLKDFGFAPMVIVGNQSDRQEDSQVSLEEGIQVAKNWNIPFLEASAKSRMNVKAFMNWFDK